MIAYIETFNTFLVALKAVAPYISQQFGSLIDYSLESTHTVLVFAMLLKMSGEIFDSRRKRSDYRKHIEEEGGGVSWCSLHLKEKSISSHLEFQMYQYRPHWNSEIEPSPGELRYDCGPSGNRNARQVLPVKDAT